MLRRHPQTVHQLLRPHRAKLRKGRCGSHPRLVLYVPASVVLLLERQLFRPVEGRR